MNNQNENTSLPVIEVKGLKKSFGDVAAVADVSFSVKRGELFGFLGPNGAGKTTTINMLTGLARPDSGIIKFDQIESTKNPKLIQHLIGVVPDDSNLYPEMTGFENLCFCAAIYGLNKSSREDRARQLLQDFGLDQAADRKFGGYSKGMKRKLTIAAGIIHRPKILFLDEPTTGIDVDSARRIRERIKQLNDEGCTVFLTTHYLEEAERLCDRIAFIVKGRVVQVGAVSMLMRDFEDRKILQFTLNKTDASLCERIGKTFPGLSCTILSDTNLRVYSDETIDIVPIVQLFKDEALEVMEARRIRPSLEEVFVQVTGLGAEVLKNDKAGRGKGK